MNGIAFHRRPARAFVAFGANLGDPATAYAYALARIAALRRTQVVRRSALYLSAPVGVTGQPDYTNAVIEIQTLLSAPALLAALLCIERQGGRTRASHRAPRVIDLDLLLYNDETIRAPGLEVPHPRMHRRAFVLVPLAEIAPDALIPGHGPVVDLLPRVADQPVHRLYEEAVHRQAQA